MQVTTSPLPPEHAQRIIAVDKILPQTQCTQCGYAGCLPYAQAMVLNDAPINRCPPGGDAIIQQLANFLGRTVTPLDEQCGKHKDLRIAWIEEEHCIGCTLCIKACPVDAILGANKRMHTVIPELCSGCELCLPVCPVDCIQMGATRTWSISDANQARQRTYQRQARLVRITHEKSIKLEQKALVKQASLTRDGQYDRKHAIIAAALERARQKRKTHEPN